jgi:hypothetical protein
MQYVKLGSTGVDVSKICLGCMSFGKPGKENGVLLLTTALLTEGNAMANEEKPTDVIFGFGTENTAYAKYLGSWKPAD